MVHAKFLRMILGLRSMKKRLKFSLLGLMIHGFQSCGHLQILESICMDNRVARESLTSPSSNALARGPCAPWTSVIGSFALVMRAHIPSASMT